LVIIVTNISKDKEGFIPEAKRGEFVKHEDTKDMKNATNK